jgi:hypothetical protein
LDRLTDWVGLPRSPALREEANRENINASRREVLPRWEEWPEADRQLLLRHCGELMQLYGYANEPGRGLANSAAGEQARLFSSTMQL